MSTCCVPSIALKVMEGHKYESDKALTLEKSRKSKKSGHAEILPVSRPPVYPQVSAFLFDRMETKEKVRPK